MVKLKGDSLLVVASCFLPVLVQLRAQLVLVLSILGSSHTVFEHEADKAKQPSEEHEDQATGHQRAARTRRVHLDAKTLGLCYSQSLVNLVTVLDVTCWLRSLPNRTS